MELVSIRELRKRAEIAPAPFEIHAQIESASKKTARSGKPFIELKLADGEDAMVIRAWEEAPAYQQASNLNGGAFVRVVGGWFRNDPYGIEPQDWSVTELSEEEARQLLGGSEERRVKQDADFAEITAFIEEMSDPRLKGVCGAFLKQFGDRFRRTGAARNYHHARRGGLVEHVAQMMRCARAVCSVYPKLNRDLVVAGVLFHDCGKLWENCYAEADFTMPYTDVGELISHIPLGMELVNKLWRELMESEEAKTWKEAKPTNDQVRLHLLHLIGSHHGEMAFGAPVVPKTPEAIVLHHVDNIDAKYEMFDRGYETSSLLSKNIFERVRPLPSRMVRPLGAFLPPGAEDEPPAAEPF
ncbi:MAG: 3'-5' exoribonuclease [Verrucomicrobiales bacterium]|jgi:3'-5' exoribonuclease